MAQDWTQIMGFDPQELHLSLSVGEAVGRWLKHRHPINTAKEVARAAGVDPRTAENILAGHLSANTFTRLCRAYGWAFLAAVGAATIGEAYEDAINRELEEIANERRDIEARERRLRGSYARLHTRRTVDPGGLRLVHPADEPADREARQ